MEYGILSHEKLSDGIFTTTDEDISTSVDLNDSSNDSDISFEEFLESRKQTFLLEKCTALRIALQTLSEQVKEESILWKIEVEETLNHQEKLSEVWCDQQSECFQKQSLQLQEAILRAQAEKKAKIQREIAITSYKTQLLQVENMCNLELTRVKQSKQNLQPLQMIASEWDMVNDKGDFNRDSEKVNKEKIFTVNSDMSLKISESVKELFEEMNLMYNEVASKFSDVSYNIVNEE